MRRLRGALAWWAVVAVVTSLAGAAVRPNTAHAAQTIRQDAHLRFQGYIQSTDAATWTISSTVVVVDANTVLNEAHGRAEKNAWVTVWATQRGNQPLRADAITVERSAAQLGPTVQFTGVLEKQSPQEWSVSGTLILLDDGVSISGHPTTGSLIRVVAEDREGILYALTIELIADASGAVPVQFEGQIQKMETDAWLIDDSVVHVITGTGTLTGTVIIGQPAVGKRVEVEATLDASRELWARLVRVLDQPQPGGNEAGGLTSPAQARGGAFGAYANVTLKLAGLETLDMPLSGTLWSVPVPIASHLAHAARPALAFTADGWAHAVWESDGELLYATRPPGGAWGGAEYVAMGAAPSLVAGADGTLHMVFANQFMGNDEVYYVARAGGHWSLPVNVSRTSGHSSAPVLAVSSTGALHAAWMDDTPGGWVIYHGSAEGPFWTSQPVPNAPGESPALTTTGDGVVFLAWHDRVGGPGNSSAGSDVFLSQIAGRDWSLPVNVSDSAQVDSENVALTASSDGLAQVVWVEGKQQIAYSYGRGTAWSVPETVAEGSGTAVGPHIVAERGVLLHVAWFQGGTLWAAQARAAAALWSPAAEVAAPAGGLNDATMTLVPQGGVDVSWIQTDGPDDTSILESFHASALSRRTWLPVIVR